MTTPQIIMIVIITLGVISLCLEKDPSKALGQSIGMFIVQGTIYWGGFWS